MNEQPAARFIGLGIWIHIKNSYKNISSDLCGKIENVRFVPSLNDKSGYKGKTYVVVLDRLVIPGVLESDDFTTKYDKLFRRHVTTYLSENIPSAPVPPMTFLIFVPNSVKEDERYVTEFIQRDITMSEAQETFLQEKANELCASIGKNVSNFLNEFKKTAKNEELRDPIRDRDFPGSGYHAEDEILEGIFQYTPDRSDACVCPTGGNTLVLPFDYEIKKQRRSGSHSSRYGLYSVETFGLDPWPFVVVRLQGVWNPRDTLYYAIARIDGKFYVRKIRKAETESQYETLTLLGITELLTRAVA
jgi:hypothetical protein